MGRRSKMVVVAFALLLESCCKYSSEYDAINALTLNCLNMGQGVPDSFTTTMDDNGCYTAQGRCSDGGLLGDPPPFMPATP